MPFLNLLLCFPFAVGLPPQSTDFEMPGFVSPPAAPPGGVKLDILQSTPYKAQKELRTNGMLTPGHNVPPENVSFGLFTYKCVGEIVEFQEGQTPEQIAANYSIPWQIFRESNIPFFYKDHRDLKQGDKLCLPRIDWSKEVRDNDELNETSMSEVATDCSLSHVVKSGDTLHTIATAYGITIDHLAALNTITLKDRLSVGQKLCLPSSSSQAGPINDFEDSDEAMTSPERTEWMKEPHPDSIQAHEWYHPGNAAEMNSDAALQKLREHDSIMQKYKDDVKEALKDAPKEQIQQLLKEAEDAPTPADSLPLQKQKA